MNRRSLDRLPNLLLPLIVQLGVSNEVVVECLPNVTGGNDVPPQRHLIGDINLLQIVGEDQLVTIVSKEVGMIICS